MKKIFLALIIFCANFLNANAQFVTIPDANFVNYLTANYPGAMVGNQMDTTHVDIVSATNVNVLGLSISDLFGIQYFDNLSYLNCDNNNLTSLSSLPISIDSLDCSNNQLLSLPILPNNLSYIKATSNQLIALPILPISLTFLQVTANQITSLPALPSSLDVLYCSQNQLTSLPTLPLSLTKLSCFANMLNALPALPSSLYELNCALNQIAILPTLPSLGYLDCSNNALTNLPSLSSSLFWLICSYNQLTSLPTLPNSLIYLNCEYNQISVLPSSNNLFDLVCHHNLITNFPVFSNSLLHLSCGYNPLIGGLPSLPNNLQWLDCEGLQLSILPSLPSTLEFLYCSRNSLTYLPLLPDSIKELRAYSNYNLTCLPKLPNKINRIDIDSTSISCLPNLFQLIDDTVYSTSNITSYPLCNVGGNCPVYYNITGNIHQDSSTTCALDSTNPGAKLANLKVQMLKNNIVQDQFYTVPSGEYSFYAKIGDSLEVIIDTTGLPFSISCPNTFKHTVVLTPLDSTRTNVNFGVKQIGIDAGVESIYGRFRNTFTSHVQLKAGDVTRFYNFVGTAFGGTVTTTFSGPVQYVSQAVGALIPTSVVGNTITYTVANFSILSDTAFDILLQTDTNASPGASVCITTKITNVVGDIRSVNDSLTNCFIVVNSFDPNEKSVYPQNAKAGDWLTYTVQFQNTGNDTAFLVVIKDTLSSNLDIASFTYLASSHNGITQLKNNVATFTFANIYLIDSFHNEPKSHGWIKFKIKLKNGLPINTITKNKASIYFDYNAPIVTNTTINTIQPLGIKSNVYANATLKLYPNPATNSVMIEHNMQGNISAKIVALDGRLVYSTPIVHNKQSVNIRSLNAGIYNIILSNQYGEKKVEKLVIE